MTPPLTTTSVPHSAPPSALRARIIAMALVPSMLFVIAGLAGGWYLTRDAQQGQSQAALASRKVGLVDRFLVAVLDERDAAVRGSAGDRSRVDTTVGEITSLAGEVTTGAPSPLSRSVVRLRDAAAGVAVARRQVQGDGLRGLDAYEAYEPVVELARGSLAGSTIDGAAADVVAAFDGAGSLIEAAGSVRDAAMLADQAQGPGPAVSPDFAAHAETFRVAFGSAVSTLNGARHDQVVALLATPEWKQFSAAVTAVLTAPVPAPATDTAGTGRSSTTAARAPAPNLGALGATLATDATDIAVATATDAAAEQSAAADRLLTTITIAVLATVGVAVVAMFFAHRSGLRLIRRLGQLRDDTLHTADQLPRVLDRLRDGEEVDVHAEIPDLERGDDEIGQVAAAVTVAQRAAADAAGEEARTRAGANAVFLNIAHRSQAIVHRQLQILDEAERAESNSDQLSRLYQLDHLTTRERRNAENLIIMGGLQPRRQWRRPVAMADVARSAISESEQYTRITLGEVPETYVDGAAVGDLIHLLAELVDNATSFSPPQCPIDVQAHAVGRGVVIEVQDRGLGIEPEPRARLNQMLAQPPDFGLMTLSDDSRLGIFVVARLAHRHGVRVTLMESPYGGVQAIVLVPNAVLVDASAADEATSTDDGPERAGPERAGNGYTNGSRNGSANGHGGTASGVAPAPAGETAAAPVAPAPEPVADEAPVDESVVPDPPPAPLPVLPERQPQVHLARELHDEPDLDDDVTDDEPPVQRSRSAMSALQKGSRAARSGQPPGRNGDRP